MKRNLTAKRRYRSHIVVLALYGLLSLILTWPLVAHLSTRAIGSAVWAFDEYTFVWNMWWFKFSLLDLGQTPLHTTYTFYPLGIDLVSYTLNLFNGMLGLPLQLALPLPLASNLVILFTYAMGGYGGYLLVCYLLVTDGRRKGELGDGLPLTYRTAAFVAGAAYAFTAARMVYAALGHYNVLTAQWFPFYALFLLKTWREPGWRNPILAGVWTTFILLAEPFFGVFWLFLTVLLSVFELFRKRRESLWRVIGRLAVMGLTVVVLWSPVLVAILRAFLAGGFDLAGWGHGARLSADLVGWFTPTALHPLFGAEDWPAHLRAVVEGKTLFQDINTVFLGYGILLLAVVGALSAWKRVRVWVLGAVIFAIFTLGPLLQIKGRFLFPLDNLLREQGIPQDVTFPLPFALLHYIPFLKANRVPNRFSIILCLALAVLVGFGVLALLRKLPKSRRGLTLAVGALLLIVVLFDQLAVPLPLTDARIPAPYRAIAAEEDDFAVMTIPFGWRDSFGTKGSERTQVQYYQTLHHKRFLTGNTSRAPAFKFDYFLRIPLFRALTLVELYNPVDEETLARAREQTGDLMTLYDVRYLIVHDPVPLRYPEVDTTADALELAQSLMPLSPEPVGSGDGVIVYGVIQPPVPDPLRIDFGDWTAAPYRGEGWNDDEDVFAASANWALGTEAQIFFPVRGTGDRHLAIQIAPFAYSGVPLQTVTLSLNGQPLDASFPLGEGWQVVQATLPEPALRPGLNTLTLHFDHATQPVAVLPGASDERPLSAAVDWLEISLR